MPPRSAYGGRVQGLQIAAQQDREERRLREAEDTAEQNRMLRERADRRAGSAQAFQAFEARKNRKLRERQLGLQESQSAASAERADKALALDEKRFGLTEAREKRSAEAYQASKAKAQQDAAMKRMADAYQLADMGFEDQALEVLNAGLPPEKRADSIAREGDTFLIGRMGEVSEVPLSRIQRYLPRDSAATARPPSLTPEQKAGEKFKKGSEEVKMLADFQKRWATESLGEKMSAANKALIIAGMRAGRPEKEIADAIGAPPSSDYGELEIATKEVQRLEGLLDQGELGGFRKKNVNKWLKQRAIKKDLEKKLGITLDQSASEDGATPVDAEQTAAPTGTGTITDPATGQTLTTEQLRGRTPEGMTVSGGAPKQQDIIKEYPAYDTDKDGKIDDLDQDYADAKRAVMLASDPVKRRKVVEWLNRHSSGGGERLLTEMEALVDAVNKRARAQAEARVGRP